ncbi:MAG: MBL fold metallo-hydrolase [bacterium]|nr:MBL fold metallo-hydrolase [bacterium]MDT8394882.1 MBL fold metallo-hydrolase [bacterium]
MKIKYLGHSSFLLTTGDGTRIVTDPYEPGSYDGAVKYRPIKEEADVVLISHGHPDHNYSAGVPGSFTVLDKPGENTVSGVNILGVPAFHDSSRGSERGEVVIFRIEADGLSVCHLGDLGHTLDGGTVDSLMPVDILLVPVGGFFTVGGEEIDAIIDALEPKLVIPMHFKTDGVDFPIAPVENFLSGRKDVTWEGASEVDVSASALPEGVLVLNPANLPQ